MATDNVVKSAFNTLSGSTADTVNLTQWWDRIEISNTGTTAMYATFNGTTPTVAADGTEIIEAGTTKIFSAGIQNGAGVVGSTTAPCHVVKVVGSSNTYGVIGVSGR